MKKFFSILILFIVLTPLASAPVDRASLWRDFLIREGQEWSPHFRNQGTIRSLYGRGRISHRSGEEAASAFIRNYSPMLGIDRVEDLRLESAEKEVDGSHFYYRQYEAGLPVVNAVVAIHLDQTNKIIAVNSSVQPDLNVASIFTNTVEAARATVTRMKKGHIVVSPPRLMILPMGSVGVPVWRVEVGSTRIEEGSWLLYVDARYPTIVLRAFKTYASFNGRGNVWLQNPVVTPNRSFQTFKNMDASKRLSGKFVRVFNAKNVYDFFQFIIDRSVFSTASDPNRNYNYAPGDLRLSEAMAFFHINRVHDQWRSFGFNGLNKAVTVIVNAAESGFLEGLDNAFYTRFGGALVFGAGHRLENFGLDSDVYYHEYGHDVLDHVKPGFFETIESNYPGAFHEAFGDISASAITGNSKLAEFALRTRVGKRFIGRDLENTNRFPQNVIEPSLHKSEVHHAGLIAGGSWWDLQQAIGSRQAQNILFRSLKLMPDEMDFFDWRDAMLTADRNSTGGVDRQAILDAFAAHGLREDPGQPGQINVSSLKAALLNENTGKLTIRNTFSPGQRIFILANYKANRLTPGYNLIPMNVQFKSPAGNSEHASLQLFVDEVINGVHTGVHAAVQAEVSTDSQAVTGTYSITIQSRLGGTDRVGPKKTVKFTIH